MQSSKPSTVQQLGSPPTNLTGIAEKYQLKNDQEVLHFLEEHQDIASFLNDTTYGEIRKYFLQNPLRLYVAHDPEDCQLHLLMLSIVSDPEQVDESYEKLMAFEEDWYLAASYEVCDRLCLDLDFE